MKIYFGKYALFIHNLFDDELGLRPLIFITEFFSIGVYLNQNSIKFIKE